MTAISETTELEAGQRSLRLAATALTQLADGLGAPFTATVALMLGLKGRVICTGMGKSGHVARKIAATLASTGQPAMFVHPGEASHGDLGMVGADDAILALSKTGETRELADIIAYSRRFDIPLIGMCAARDSALGQASDIVLLLPDVAEAVEDFNAPTTSTTAQIALGDAIAVALAERRGFGAQEFRIFHPGGKLGAALRTVGEVMHGPEELPLTQANTPMSEALITMTEKRFGCVGVVDDDGALVGVVTDGDLRRHMQGLLAHTAGQIMTPSPLVVAPQLLAGQALGLMNSRRVTVLFVTENARPVGVLHIHDLLRLGVA